MTQDTQPKLYDLSRRQVLGGLGAVGLASAGAGLGTSAFFRDDESVSAALTAGRLDLKLDYRATYNAWLDEAETDAIVDGSVLADPDFENTFLVGQAPDIRDGDGNALPGADWAAFTRSSNACAVDDPESLDAELARVGSFTGTDYTAVDDGEAGYIGPEGQVYVDGETGVMFDLDDVKPKDEGEATISLHTCGNPAFLFAQARVLEESENDLVEPEATAGDESMDAGELANYIYTRVWDDVNCNNRPDGGAADIAVVFDHSCSMEWLDPFSGCNESENTSVPGKLESAQFGAKDLYQTLLDNDADAQVAFIPYASNATLAYDLAEVNGSNQASYDGAVDTDYNSSPDDLGSSTAIADGINGAKNVLLGNTAESTVEGITSSNDRDDAEKVMIILSDGFPNDPNVVGGNVADAQAAIEAAQRARAAGITVYTITYQVEGFPIPELIDLMGTGFASPTGPFGFDTPDGQGFASTSSTAIVATVAQGALGTPSSTEIVDAFEEIATTIAGGDDFLYQGSLAGLVAATDGGLNLRTARTEVDGEEGEPQCFPGGVYCYAFDWYFVCEDADFELVSDVEGAATIGEELDAAGLPRDPNVAQTDSIRFALDFAAVQCRHNMDPVSPFAEPAESA